MGERWGDYPRNETVAYGPMDFEYIKEFLNNGVAPKTNSYQVLSSGQSGHHNHGGAIIAVAESVRMQCTSSMSTSNIINKIKYSLNKREEVNAERLTIEFMDKSAWVIIFIGVFQNALQLHVQRIFIMVNFHSTGTVDPQILFSMLVSFLVTVLLIARFVSPTMWLYRLSNNFEWEDRNTKDRLWKHFRWPFAGFVIYILAILCSLILAAISFFFRTAMSQDNTCGSRDGC